MDENLIFHKGMIFRGKMQLLDNKLNESVSKKVASVLINQHMRISHNESKNRFKSVAKDKQNKIFKELGLYRQNLD